MRLNSNDCWAVLFTSMLSPVVIAATALACASVSAQSPGPAPSALQVRPKLPPGVRPRPGHGERLLLPTAAGESQVVRLYCSLDPYAMVMLPTGELKII